ncbi:aldo/keto reductase [Paenibacillus sp. DMB5]|uniref:aldo/keto reductase n=1 Tax=Paenibacillus sp. DMB5 TaxID=1780103 RepID=UPI00076C39B0|nr:aldo/keto reductase [Paenibacillus sp. DMB5]KUP20538.1 oxidoreductase [Paenibacillus sp. DMB5]KUP26302.1 oxidoreductase [Paenibacillus sp. DMB5]
MNKNRLGQSDLYVSAMGLGCMSLGTEEAPAVSIIHEALDKGINFLDTADLYDAGRNEEIVGNAIRGRRSDVVLATKVGNRRIPGQEGWSWDASKAYIKSAVHDSLRRLQTDYIDLYQLHGGTMEDNIDETIEVFEELKQEGLIRYYGISSIRPAVVREYVKRSGIVSVMSQYSILDRRPEESVLPLLEQNGISLIARGPLARGILTDNGRSRLEKDYLDYSVPELASLQDRLTQQAPPSRTLTQTALHYPLSQPAVAAVIPGASSLEQLRLNIAAAEAAPLTAAEADAVRQASKASVYTAHR